MSELRLRTSKCSIEIVDEGVHYSSFEKLRPYSKEYLLSNGKLHASRRGIIAKAKDGTQVSCLVYAHGGPTSVYEHSATIIGDLLFLAVGSQLCCLHLPALQLGWHMEVDLATCFGIHYSPEHNCLISHGEIEIARLSLDGEIQWKVSGKDIFTGDLHLFANHIEVTDFNMERYRIRITDGHSQIVDGPG